MTHTSRALLGLAACLVLALPANAVSTTYTSRVAFLGAAGSVTTENFNAFATEVSFQTSPVVLADFSIAGYGANQFDRNFIDLVPHQFAFFDIDGTTNVNSVTATDSGLTFTFSSAITAWGADFAAFQDTVQRSQIVAAGETFTPPVQAAGNVLSFFGIVSDTPFTTVRFTGNAQSDGFSVDNVTYSSTNSVPEPASSVLLFAGLGLLGIARRLRSRI